MKRILLTVLSMVLVLYFGVSAWAAAPIRVDCGKGGSINATLAGLAQSGNTRNVTIFVTGTCKENITIGGFDHLLLQALPIATLQDASNGTAPVVAILGSYSVGLLGFTINGGSEGVDCGGSSACSLGSNTIQQSLGVGVAIRRSGAYLGGNNILNNATDGIDLIASTVLTESNTISDNGAVGIGVYYGSRLVADSEKVQNNAVGIRAVDSSVVRLLSGLTISDNQSDGVRLESGSTASFEGGTVVAGNGGNGLAINDLSFAGFSGMNNVSGNLTQPDVACYPQYSATRGAGTVGGTTNCNEPQKDQQRSPQMKGDGPSDCQ